MSREQRILRLSRWFSKALRLLVEDAYCLGAASEDEIRAAYIDFLRGIISDTARDMKLPTLVPYRRYD